VTAQRTDANGSRGEGPLYALAVAPERRDRDDELVRDLLERTHELAQARERIDELEADEESARRELARIDESVTWRLFQRARGRLYGRVGQDSMAGRAVGGTLRAVGRAAGTDAWPPVTLPRVPEPEVSIVIAARDGARLTWRCLRAIAAGTDGIAYEVIVVDDDADRETRAMLTAVDGVRVVANEGNLGYLRSVNRGAAQARGEFLVLLNNDTEPRPGWLAALVDRVRSADDIGVVVAKLLYPGGMLQEAGGIVWRDLAHGGFHAVEPRLSLASQRRRLLGRGEHLAHRPHQLL
jgi:hypothetical protein